MLTHAAMVSEVASITTFLQEGEIACGEGDSILSYLTLAHILDRVVEDFLLSAGGCIGYWQVMPRLQPHACSASPLNELWHVSSLLRYARYAASCRCDGDGCLTFKFVMLQHHQAHSCLDITALQCNHNPGSACLAWTSCQSVERIMH